jgi:arsenate reductase
MASHVMTQADRVCLNSAATDLHADFRGIFGQKTIESLLLESYAELASRATVSQWLRWAAGWFSHLAGDRAAAWSGRSEPVAGLDPAVVQAMAEAGIDISRSSPTGCYRELSVIDAWCNGLQTRDGTVSVG